MHTVLLASLGCCSLHSLRGGLIGSRPLGRNPNAIPVIAKFGFLRNWGMRSKHGTVSCSAGRDPHHLSIDISPRCTIRRPRFRICIQFLWFCSNCPSSQLQTQPWPSPQQETWWPLPALALGWGMLLLLHAGLWWSLTFRPPRSYSSLNDVSANNRQGCDTERKTHGKLY